MTLLHPLFLIPAVACLLLFAFLRRQASVDSWSVVLSREVLAYLRPVSRTSRHREPVLLALVLTFAALASPALRSTHSEAYVPSEGLAVLVDVSRSMTLSDIRPNRIAAAKAVATAISDAAPTRPAALIVYAGDAFLAQPFSVDREQYRSFVAALDHGLVPSEGSAMARALALAQSTLRQSGLPASRLVLLTDGGGADSDAEDAARQLKPLGARIDVVHFALPETPEPAPTDRARLAAIASLTGGQVIDVDTFGAFDIAALDLGSPSGGYSLLALDTTAWRNQSHFLLLLLLPLTLSLFRRARE